MKHAARRALRSSLLELGSGTKAELSNKLGISFPTVGKVLEQMKQEGEVALLGLDESSGGRRANRYAFNPDYMLGLAVYYEKEQSVYTLFNWNGDLIERTVEDAVLHRGPEALASQLGNWTRNYPKIRSIAAGLPAPFVMASFFISQRMEPFRTMTSSPIWRPCTPFLSW